MRTNILFWLTFALIVLDVNAVLDSQGTSGTITKLIPQINSDPSANEKVKQVDIGNSNKNNNDKSHQSQDTGKYEDEMQLAMNGQQRAHPVFKVLSKANSPGSSTAVIGLAKRRFMRRGGNTTPAQQSDLLTNTLGRKLVTIDASRQVTSNPDQKSKNAPGRQPGAVDGLLGKQAIEVVDSNNAKKNPKQGEESPVLTLATGSDTIGKVTPPNNLPGPVGLSSQQPKQKSDA